MQTMPANVTVKPQVLISLYEYVVQVIMSQKIGAGCHYFAKGYWVVESDLYTLHTYTIITLFCVRTVF